VRRPYSLQTDRLQQRLGPERVFGEQHLTLAAQGDLAEHLLQNDVRLGGCAWIAVESPRDLLTV